MNWRGLLADAGLLAAALLIFGALSLPHLDLPGLYYDEAVDALPAMQLLTRQEVTLTRGAGVEFRSRQLPLMAMDYVGAVHTYAAVPFFAWFGVGAAPLRLMTVAGGALTVALTFLLGRMLFGSAAGFLAALLLAVHPSFIFYVRQGVHVSSLLSVFVAGSLLALWAWRRTGSLPALMLGSFLLGLGLWTKILFLWHITALLAVGALALAASIAARLRRSPAILGLPALLALGAGGGPATLAPKLSAKTPDGDAGVGDVIPRGVAGHPLWRSLRLLLALAGAPLAFLAGAWPLVLFNLKTGGTLDVILKNSGRTQSGVDNADWLANMGVRLESLRVLLTGEHFWWLGGLFGFNPYPALAGLLVGMLPLLLWLQRRRFDSMAAPAGALLLVGLLVLGQSAFTVAGLWPTHLFPFMPLLMLLMALSLVLLARLPWLRPAPLVLAGTLAAALLGGSLWTTVRYHGALEETGGRRAQSDAIYRLTEALERAPGAGPVLAMDWGIAAPVTLLTSGRVTPQEVFFFSPEPPPLFTDWMYGAMTGPGPRHFVFHPPDSTYYPRFALFSELAQRWEKQVELVDTIRERDGTPIYLMYTVR